MSDHTADIGSHHIKRVPKAEFFVYFTLIFALSFLPHVLGWTFQALRHMTLPRFGPLARAWKDAAAITPMIFRT